ncbi:MAG TPA: response regulator [Nitrospirae bacterium]|nr:response regulator [Nitrospirota bacterium]
MEKHTVEAGAQDFAGSDSGKEDNKNYTVLVVDDNDDNIFLLESIITSHGYNVISASGGQEALDLIKSKRAELDIIILDVMMPVIDGLEVTRSIKSNSRTRHIPVILLTAKQKDRKDVAKGLDLGADDYLSKPVDSMELLARIRSSLQTKKLQDKLTQMNDQLEQLVEERTIEIMLTRNAAIFGFAKLAEYRDPETGSHLERIRNYTKILADELKNFPQFQEEVDDEFVTTIFQSSPLHDIGKVGIPDEILLKPGGLTREEFKIMKSHVTIGGDSLASTGKLFGDDSFLSMGRDIAYHHHEKWNGKGYPNGLKGEQIPLPARIMALADVFDALVSKRVYKEAMSLENARDIILAGEGEHFDPDIVKAFRNIEDSFAGIKDQYTD